jgi:hypothetical protein
MHLNRYFPKNYEAILGLAHKASQGADTVIMQAGHFLLYNDPANNKILPCLDEGLVESRHDEIRQNYAQFPILTWRLGLRLLASLPASAKHIMVVVNDWQYLSKGSNRADFYANYAHLPGSYADELARYSGAISLFAPKKTKPGTSTAPFFGEMNLRNRYQRHVTKLIAAKKLPQQAVLQTCGNTVHCTFPDLAGFQREAYCSGQAGDCAGEIAEMIHDAGSRGGAACFINLYPLVCREHVELGSQWAVDLLQSTCGTVLNLGFQSAAVRDERHLIETAEATLHQRLSNHTGPAT